MINSELVNNTRENTKMSFNKKIFDFFMNEYINQDMNSYSSNNGEALFDFIRINGSNASSMNQEDYKKLILKLINQSIEVSKQNGTHLTTQALTAKLLTGLQRRAGRLTFDSEELFGIKVDGEKNIFFYLDVDGKDIIGVLNDIIDQMDNKGIAYDITIPNAPEIVRGHTDAITIAVSPESYMSTVEALENVSQENKDKAKDNDYARNNWFGVNTVVDGIPADELIGKLFIQAMNEVLAEESTKYPDLLVDGESVGTLIQGSVNKDESRQHSYNEILKLDNTIGDKIYNRILLLIKQNGLDPDNMFVYNIINDELDKLYGKNIEENQEVVEQPQEQEVEEVPLGQAIDDFVKSLDEEKAKEEQPAVKLTEEDINKIDSQIEQSPYEEAPKQVEQPQSANDIVADTMEMVGKEVQQMVKGTTPISESKMLLSDTIVALSPEEKKSMADAIDQTQVNLERENNYLGLLDGVEGWTFDSKVKDVDGKDITLLDFLDNNNTLTKIPFDSVVTLLDTTTEDGVSVSGKKFISKYVLDSLKLNQTNPVSPGGLTLEEIMEKYIEKIETKDMGIIYPEGLTAPVRSSESIIKRFLKRR